VRVLGRGDSVGELALLTESPRSASVRARRDSELLLITREHFARLMEQRPEFAAGLTRVLGRQLRDVRHAGLEPDPVPSTITIVGLCANVPVRDVGSYLALHLSQWQSVLGIDDTRARDAANGETDDDADAAYARLLDGAERDHQQVVMMAPVPDPADHWTAFSVRAADRLIGVCRGREAPPEGIAGIRRLQGCDLVMTSDGHEQDARLDAWVEALQPRSVRIVPESGGDQGPGIESLARRLAGRSVGLVLSGGGARAFAHVGVLRGLTEAGVEIDRVAGCSGGAWIGAQFALGRSPDEIRTNCFEEFVKRNPLNDYTLPLVALTRSLKGNAMMDRVFGDVRFEELEREFFCVSCDMISSELVVHRRGRLWPAVAASMTLPGYLPPKSIDGRLLLDGGVLNNLPVDVMAATGEGPIIASDVSARYQPPAMRPQRGRRPRTAKLAARLRRWVVGTDALLPGFGETVVRSILLGSIDTAEAAQRYADVVIEPEVAGVGLLEWDRVDDMIDAGRAAAEEALAKLPAGVL
jgi:NTE family protein